MSIFEYNEEEEMRKIRASEYKNGKEDGIAQGIKQGIEQGIEQGMYQRRHSGRFPVVTESGGDSSVNL